MKILMTLGMIGGLFLIGMHASVAGIYLDTTRIIFDADNQRGVRVGVGSSKLSKTPYLIKAQVADTPLVTTPSAFFITSPSLFRVDPDNVQSVLIMKKEGVLPQDRESVFYFRAIATATSKPLVDAPTNSVGTDVQVSSMSVIKLFYRPKLAIKSVDSWGKLEFHATAQGIKIRNPTPHHVTLTKASVNNADLDLTANKNSPMLAPFSEQVYPTASQQGRVTWTVINDYGGQEVFNGHVK